MNDQNSKGRPANGLRSFISFRLSRLQAQLNAQAQHILRTHSNLGQTEWRVLTLVAHQGTTTMAHLVRESRIDKAQISRAVKSLTGKGLLLTQPNPDDQRQQLLNVSDAGRALHDRMLPIMRGRQSELTGQISADDLETFHRIIDKLEAAALKRDF